MNAPFDWAGHCEALADPVARACEASPVAGGPTVLARELASRLPEWRFREVLCRGGWYRVGAVVAPSGERVADSVEAWATAALEACDGDIGALCEDFAGSGLRVTRLSGRTHTLVAPTGEGAGDFLQLEIEEIQEILGEPLFDRAQAPTTFEQLVDPRVCRGAGTPLGRPWYAPRRVAHVGDVLAKARGLAPQRPPVDRFLGDWESSSAQRATAFCNHWVVAIREHLDRYRQKIVQARPLPALHGDPAPLGLPEGTAGLPLHEAIAAFDRRAGYPFAWYFHMLTTKTVPFWVARQVVDDAGAGYAYLPERDLAVVRDWLRSGYAF